MDRTERVILYDELVDIGLLEELFDREILIGLEQLYSCELDNNIDILKTYRLNWMLKSNITCYNICITEKELELLDDWYCVPLLSKRTLLIALGKLSWIYYNNPQDLFLGRSNLDIIDKEELRNRLNKFKADREEE